jgi:cell division protein FtsL
MVEDYSGRYVVKNCRNKKKKAPKSKNLLSATRLMWKTLGAILLVTVIIGITSTIWYGWQVQLALNQIGRDKTTNSELEDENRLLRAQRNLLLTQEQMEKAAETIGLYAPTKKQLRYP